MSILRLQNLTPETYAAGSRDFQLLCRLYDSVFNGIKYDTDSIKYLTNTSLAQSSILPLLETKVGFFTHKKLDDNEVRYIVRVFPELVRNKGSLLSIKKLLNMCLKLSGIPGTFTISVSENSTVINGIVVDAHTIIVGIDTILKNVTILNEIAKYILPAGFGFYIYFYKDVSTMDTIFVDDDIKVLYSSSYFNAAVRGSTDNYTNYLDNSMLGGVDIGWINSIDNKYTNDFLGIFDSVSNLPAGRRGNIALANGDMYYYTSIWNKLNFIGTYDELNEITIPNPSVYDLAAIDNNNRYLVYYSNAPIECNYRGFFKTASSVTNPVSGDLISTSTVDYYLYRSGAWRQVNYKGKFSSTTQIPTDYKSTNYNLVLINGANYYIYLNGTWNDYTNTIYVLNHAYITNNQ